MSDGLTFNPENHEYRFNGERVLSVTQILAANGMYDFSHVDPAVLAYRGMVGKAVHAAVDLDARGVLDVDSLDQTVAAHLVHWHAARDVLEKKYGVAGAEKHEFRLFSKDAYRVAGTLDVAWLYEKWALIVDAKTGAKTEATGLQLSGYEHILTRLFPEIKKVIRIAAHITETDFELVEYKNAMDKHIFLSMANVANYKLKRGMV